MTEKIKEALEYFDSRYFGKDYIIDHGKTLAAAYRDMREIAWAMAAILERRVGWEHAGDILNRYEEAIK